MNMIKNVNYKLTFYILAPFLVLFSYWLIIGVKFENLFPQLINSLFTGIIFTLGIATMTSWWFCLSRSSTVKTPLFLTIILTIIIFMFNIILSFNYFQNTGLYTPIAIHLNNGLESLTILLSLCFVLIIGILIFKDAKFKEEE